MQNDLHIYAGYVDADRKRPNSTKSSRHPPMGVLWRPLFSIALGAGSATLIFLIHTINSLVADDAGTSAFVFSENLVDILDCIDRPKRIHWPIGKISLLAALEHLFLGLPVRDSALWGWAMGSGDAAHRTKNTGRGE